MAKNVMRAKTTPVRYERLSTLRRVRVYPMKGRFHCVTTAAACPVKYPPGRRSTSSNATPPRMISPACRARPLRASTSGAPIRKMMKGGIAEPALMVPRTGTAVRVTPAATWTQREYGLGKKVQRPARTASAAVTITGPRSVGRTGIASEVPAR